MLAKHGSSAGITLPALSRNARIGQAVGFAVWAACFTFFWAWWLRPEHYSSLVPYVTVSFTLLWVSLTPAYFLAIFRKSRRPDSQIAMPDLRVAMVVTKAPSEPFEVVEATLEAMLAQDWPHDTWLADEAPTPEVLELSLIHI